MGLFVSPTSRRVNPNEKTAEGLSGFEKSASHRFFKKCMRLSLCSLRLCERLSVVFLARQGALNDRVILYQFNKLNNVPPKLTWKAERAEKT
jgi:hypothetical protein